MSFIKKTSLAAIAFAIIVIGGTGTAFATTSDEVKEGERKSLEAIKNWNNEVSKQSVKKYKKAKGIVETEDQSTESVMSAAASGQVGTYGDILVTMDQNASKGLFTYGHAGIVSTYSNAYTVEAFPEGGVKYHSNNWTTRYNKVKGLWVSGAEGANYKNAGSFAQSQIGKPYNLNWSKTTTSSYYCSQLVWRAWFNQGFDTDNDGGVSVWPIDLIKDTQTIAFYSKGF